MATSEIPFLHTPLLHKFSQSDLPIGRLRDDLFQSGLIERHGLESADDLLQWLNQVNEELFRQRDRWEVRNSLIIDVYGLRVTDLCGTGKARQSSLCQSTREGHVPSLFPRS